MPHEERDLGYLWDMMESARLIAQFTRGKVFHDYIADRQLQFAVERGIEIIGEAANRISKPFQDLHPEIPWRKIIAQRNVLIHEYGEIRQDRLWRVVTENISELIQMLEPLFTNPPPDEKG